MSNPKKFNRDAIILDLSKIEEILTSTSPTEKERFLRNFYRWVDQREVTLSELEKLKKELDDVCFKAKVGKGIGAGISIVGGLAAILGFGLSFSDNKSTSSAGKSISACGVGAGVLGGATSMASSVVEYKVNQRILNEVKLTLEKDQYLTRELIPYLKKSEELNSLFEEIFDCNILSDTVKDILTVVHGMTTLYKQGKYAYEEISRAFSSSVDECLWSFDLRNLKRIFRKLGTKVQIVLLEFCENPKVREAVLEVCRALNASPVIYDIAKVSIQVLLRLSGMTKRSGYSSFIWNFVSDAAKNAHVLMRTVSIAIEIVALISASKDIADSESKYSGVVAEIELFLLKELNEAKRSVNRINRN